MKLLAAADAYVLFLEPPDPRYANDSAELAHSVPYGGKTHSDDAISHIRALPEGRFFLMAEIDCSTAVALVRTILKLPRLVRRATGAQGEGVSEGSPQA